MEIAILSLSQLTALIAWIDEAQECVALPDEARPALQTLLHIQAGLQQASEADFSASNERTTAWS
jgi:hypothetical protein